MSIRWAASRWARKAPVPILDLPATDVAGTKPTVTDANLALGRYDPARFAGGTMQLDAAAAHGALLARVGSTLGLTAEMAALGVIEMVDENMANAARVHAIEFRQDL